VTQRPTISSGQHISVLVTPCPSTDNHSTKTRFVMANKGNQQPYSKLQHSCNWYHPFKNTTANRTATHHSNAKPEYLLAFQGALRAKGDYRGKLCSNNLLHIQNEPHYKSSPSYQGQF
jgi:hypothetical protein